MDVVEDKGSRKGMTERYLRLRYFKTNVCARHRSGFTLVERVPSKGLEELVG